MELVNLANRFLWRPPIGALGTYLYGLIREKVIAILKIYSRTSSEIKVLDS